MIDPALVDATGRQRVLWLSTLAFTALFAVWLMLGVLGLKIRSDTALMLGDAAASMTQAEIQTASQSRFEWLLATSILSGALLRLNFGIWSDTLGGRNMMMLLLVGCAIPTAALAYAQSYSQLLVCAALFGLAGNSFSVGIAWNSAWFPPHTKGTALGIFGAGNVGAAGTKLLVVLAPGVLSIVPLTGYLGGWIPGGWRIVPLLYAVMLLAIAVGILWLCPAQDPRPGKGRTMRDMLAPLKYVQVWRFSLYYVVVFGAYVALSAWLPSYYVATYGVDMQVASLLTALFIFPASLLRPVGGWLADRYGPRKVTYAVLLSIAVATMPLCLPRSVVPLGVAGFTALTLAVAIGMGIGKASVYAYIPHYYPQDVGTVGGLVGMLGALGGFLLPKAFGWLSRTGGFPQAGFFALLMLTLVSLAWLQWAIVTLRVRQRAADSTVAPVYATAATPP